MTYTIASDCSSISLDSDYLVPTNLTVDLFWAKNCGTTLSKISVSPSASVIQLDPTDLGETETFSDGVYYFKVVISDEDSNTIEESLCKFVNCNSTCAMIDTYTKTDLDSVIKQLSFEALLAANDCTSCSCTDLCTLYTNTGLTDINNDQCGCS